MLGRADDVIVTGGENVSPEEVEAVLLSHPAVADAAVAGRPDPEWQTAVVAYVVLNGDGRRPRKSCAPSAASGWPGTRCRRRSSWSRSCPATRQGKLLRRQLAERTGC